MDLGVPNLERVSRRRCFGGWKSREEKGLQGRSEVLSMSGPEVLCRGRAGPRVLGGPQTGPGPPAREGRDPYRGRGPMVSSVAYRTGVSRTPRRATPSPGSYPEEVNVGGREDTSLRLSVHSRFDCRSTRDPGPCRLLPTRSSSPSCPRTVQCDLTRDGNPSLN